MENKNEKDYYFEESEKFFNGIKEEIEGTNRENNNDNNDLPFWVSKR